MGKLHRHIVFIFFCTAIALVASCKKETLPPVEMGKAYYPDNDGHWVIYKVDSAVWDPFYFNYPDDPNFYKTYSFYIKEKIESHYYDLQNRLTQRIERYKKDSINGAWYYLDTWTANVTATTAQKTEENITYVKFIFPVSDGDEWNGNAYNYLGQQDYFFDKTYDTFIINNVTFDSSVTVVQKRYSNMIEEYNQYEVFAKKAGMIYKKYRAVSKIKVDGFMQIKGGVDYTYTMEDYGD